MKKVNAYRKGCLKRKSNLVKGEKNKYKESSSKTQLEIQQGNKIKTF